MENENAEVAEPPEEQAQAGRIPEFESAIRNNTASFEQLMEAYFYSRDKHNKDRVSQLAFAEYYPALNTAFQVAHGVVRKLFWCDVVVAGAVLTDKAELYVISPLSEMDIEEHIAECERLNIEVDEHVASQYRRICKDLLYAQLTNLLVYYDKKTTTSGTTQNPLPFILRNIQYAREYITRIAQRNAQISYFLGMLWGVAALTVAVTLMGFALSRSDISSLAVEPIVGSAIAGAVGAIVSVMSRMAFGRLTLSYEAGSKLLQLLGSFRPVIGSIFGVALHVLLVADLLPFVAPPDASKVLYFYIGIAFLAGFSERWAQDMLVVTQRRMTASATDEEKSLDEQPPPSLTR